MDELKRIELKLDELKKSIQFQKSILSVSEASDYTGYSLSFLYKLIHFNKIPYYKPNGRKVFFDREVLDSFLRQGLVETPEQIEKRITSRISSSSKSKIKVR